MEEALKDFIPHGPAEPWVAKGQSVDIQGYNITSGLFYVREPRPFAIEPWCTVAEPDYSTQWIQFSGEPSYNGLTPGQRGAYLYWLAHDRKEPVTVPLAHIQLFFAGVERRLFLESDYDIELGVAVADLLDRFPAARYDLPFTSWLHFFGFFSGWECHCQLLDWLLGKGHHVTTEPELALVLSSLAQAKRTVSAPLAFDLIQLHPKRSPRSGSESAQSRVKAEFIERFAARFPAGLALKPASGTKEVSYRPLSPNLASEVRLASGRLLLTWDVPDIWTANGGFRDLVRLWNEIVEDETSPKLVLSEDEVGQLHQNHKPRGADDHSISSQVPDEYLARNPRATPTAGGAPIRRPTVALSSRAKGLDPLPDRSWAIPFDPEKFRRLMNETSIIRDWLAARLPADEPTCPVLPNHKAGKPENVSTRPAGALDEKHRAMLQEILQRPSWAQADFRIVAQKAGLMPWACLATLNEWALTNYGDLLLEGDPIVTINQNLRKNIQS